MHRSGDQTLTLLSELSGKGRRRSAAHGAGGPHGACRLALAGFGTATRVPLGPLSRADAGVLAGAFVGDKPIRPRPLPFLVDRANGNPLYLRELVVMARERGLLVDDGEVYRLRAATSDRRGQRGSGPEGTRRSLCQPLGRSGRQPFGLSATATVPATLQALLAARLDALEPSRSSSSNMWR